jgi:hypothetical protein
VLTKLPAELRRKIWRLCLPHRVFELDRPVAICTYTHEPIICALSTSTYFNACPPLITRVCFESREVAFEEGTFTFEDCKPGIPEDLEWDTSNADRLEPAWRDPRRTLLFHINWCDGYTVDCGPWDGEARTGFAACGLLCGAI